MSMNKKFGEDPAPDKYDYKSVSYFINHGSVMYLLFFCKYVVRLILMCNLYYTKTQWHHF